MTLEPIDDLLVALRMTARAHGGPAWAAASAAWWGDEMARSRLAEAGGPEREADRARLGGVLRLGPGIGTDEAAALLRRSLETGGPSSLLVVKEREGAVILGQSAGAVEQAKDCLCGHPVVEPLRDPVGRMAGRVVVITGGAQGLGRGTAEVLLEEGATVWIADLNETLGRGTVADLRSRWGAGSAAFGFMDVTDSASVERSLRQCLRTFGGVDVLIANAGVLQAGGLDEMEEKAFDFVTRVNYKGYFLCVRAAAAIMKRQHVFHPLWWMDIIQVNSKSGLEGSQRNFAYAGSKFGGIGLTQSFALELLPWRIKVNAVCPGNYFEGPLWSDPEKGLFVQYLRAGKVPGAKTVEDVKAAYLAKIPMGRGCEPRDVARAILYLCEQEYETGQALPVTGGQVMLR